MARELAEFTRTARALQDVPLAHMVEAGALGVIEAQRELDRRNIEIVQQMGDPSNGIELGGRRRSLLELGLSPTFYQFTEATFTFIIDITVQESEDFSITASLGVERGERGAGARPGPGASSASSSSASAAAAPPGGATPTPGSDPAASRSSSSSASAAAAAPAATPPSPELTSPDWGDVEEVVDSDDDEEDDDK